MGKEKERESWIRKRNKQGREGREEKFSKKCHGTAFERGLFLQIFIICQLKSD